MKEDCLKIIEHYGVNHQQRKLAEEVFELQEAILECEHKYKPNPMPRTYENHIAEEIADVRVMLQEFQEYYNISDEHIEKIVNEKIQRTLKRMEKE